MDQTPITDGSITVGGPTPQATVQTSAQGGSGLQATGKTQVAGQQGTSSTTTTAQDQNTSLFDKFEIPDMVRKTYPDLVPLILETESMNDDERQYWFQILPIMTDEQVKKLREILVNEKDQLAEIDKQYNREVKQINEKHVTEWKDFERQDKRVQLQSAEKKVEQQEKTEEEALLSQLNNL